ncbi:SGNH hydrolase-type esterase domain-containing protein [Apiosordaria backusii]|uniref:SGNH hydrolase-type esterase domain-containing protein n=1 Tax=Apiosordaria backusii TaxID=314023 RepID=A0AA39ZP87_9PEZI|nr:SGNH hydrolase-type esterase domain-containing protein [Apiosordaria backusii]
MGGAPSRPATRVMVVGDSISHGREGDWTWRYRIWQWFRKHNIPVVFVGPHKGTFPPPPEDDRDRDGGYALDVAQEFLGDCYHYSWWGKQAGQVKDEIGRQVATYKPDLCLVELGFNDIGWGVSDPAGTLESMRALVKEARTYNQALKFAIANVPQRTVVPGLGDVPARVDRYNELLAQAISDWDQPSSPVALVHLCENYVCKEGAYDGLHPGALGEYEIAQAFSRTLMLPAFSLANKSTTELEIPRPIPARALSVPANLKAVASPEGPFGYYQLIITWDLVYGAYAYDIRLQLGRDHSWWAWSPVRDTRYVLACSPEGHPTPEWKVQVRATAGDHVRSDNSPVVNVIVRHEHDLET